MNKAEQSWINFIVMNGCAICGSPANVHHILSGGKRIRTKESPEGHLHSIPLCPLHHNSHRDDEEVTSRHPWKKRWEDRYQTSEREILTRLRNQYSTVWRQK